MNVTVPKFVFDFVAAAGSVIDFWFTVDDQLVYKLYVPLFVEVKFLTLGELALLYEITDKNEKDTLLISTCKTCNSKIVHYNRDIDDFNGEIYIEVNITSSDLLLEYLYVYLNSTNGLDELFYFSKGNEFIRAENIQHARIALPPKNVQKEKADR